VNGREAGVSRKVPMTAIPYGRQTISEEDIASVVAVLRSEWLTTGPAVERFEQALAAYVGVPHAVALSNGTAALHAAMAALRIGPGDEVIVPTLTFAATANCVVYQGARPVFADVAPDTLLVDPADVARRITSRTRALVAVDYAGQPADYAALAALARRHGLALVADASHALGASQDGRYVGSLADLSTFSFHPVKPITTCEGGAVTTADAELAQRMRQFRNHGISHDHRQRAELGTWGYEITELGYNYRLSDLHCALGLSQLSRLHTMRARRHQIAARYDEALAQLPGLRPLTTRPDVRHAHHLYVVRVDRDVFGAGRDAVFAALRDAEIAANVHYLPVHLHPFYRRRFATGPGDCPVAEAAFAEILTLPLFASMTDAEVERVIAALGCIAYGDRPPPLDLAPTALVGKEPGLKGTHA
jgi:perosamine synthetase